MHAKKVFCMANRDMSLTLFNAACHVCMFLVPISFYFYFFQPKMTEFAAFFVLFCSENVPERLLF